MPRFFFHLHECGDVLLDDEGTDFADLDAARRNAVASGRDIMSAEVMRGALCLSCHIVIEDADHREIERVPFRDMVKIVAL